MALSSPQLAADGTHSIQLLLTPKELGQVTASVSVQNGEVHIALVAETDVGHQAIVENLDQLKERMGDRKLTVTSSSRRPGARRPESASNHTENAQGTASHHTVSGTSIDLIL